jgi:5'-nucleotidase
MSEPQQSTPLRILISNDDGIAARGLRHLIDCMRLVAPDAQIVAVAPAGGCSGMSSAITVDRPIRLINHPDHNGAKMYSVTGTPVDCVKLGIHALFADGAMPHLMLSGVNHGSNSGNSNIYSGTMGAAMEACMIGIPAIGFSLLSHNPEADFSQTTPFVTRIISAVIAKGLPKGVCLNVNMPKDCTPQGIKVTKCSDGRWTEEYQQFEDPHGRKFYWLTGQYVNFAPDDPTGDNYWLERNYVTVTPIRPDQTHIESIPVIASLLD